MTMVEVRVAHLGLDRLTKSPVVILQEQGGPRVLPIWIGPGEASAIAMELAGMSFARPLTHDLLKQVIIGLGGTLRRVLITTVQENTFYAELHIHRLDEVVQVDCRPSDSIALALRFHAAIYANDALLDLPGDRPDLETGSALGPEPLDKQALQDYLQKLDPEDFGKFTP